MAGWRRSLTIIRLKIRKRRYLAWLAASQAAIFGLDFYLPMVISLQPYYWVPVVLCILFVPPLQVFLLSIIALAFTIASGFYWGYFLSTSYLVIVLATIVISAISILISIRLQQAAQTQQKLEERYRLLAENASDVVVFAQSDHRIRWVSPSLQSVLGWGLEDWVNSGISLFIHPQDRSALEALYARAALPTDSTAKYEQSVRIRHRNGDYRWFAIRVAAVHDATGQLTGFVKGLRDIQEQVRSRHELVAERSQLRATLDSLIDPHVLLTAIRDANGDIVDFRYTDANPAACLYNGIPRDQLIGKTLLEVLPAHQASGLLDQYIQTMYSSEPLILNDYAYPHDIYLEERRFDIRAVRINDSLSYTWRDVTDRYKVSQQLVEAKDRYQQLAQRWEFTINFGDIAIYEVDCRAGTAFYSPGVLKQLGYQAGDWSEDLDEWLRRLHPEDRVWLAQRIEVASPDLSQSDYTVEYRIQHRDGSYHWMLDRGKILTYDDQNRPLRVIGTCVDITERKQAEEALRRANQKMRMASLSAGIGFWEVDWVTGRSAWDARMWQIYGLEPGAFENTQHVWWQSMHPKDREQMELLAERINNSTSANPFFESEYRIIRWNDQQVRYIYSSIYVTHDEHEKAVFWSGINLDITQQKISEQVLALQAQTDELTGLINRRAAIAQIQALCHLDRRQREADALLFCDLDHFKSINDRYGHIAGDTVLKVTAERLQSGIRSNDFAARIGGDELLLVLRGVQSLENAVAIAEKLLRMASQPIPIEAGSAAITLTIGVTLIRPEDTVDTLIARADTAMYQGKQAGRDRVIPFT